MIDSRNLSRAFFFTFPDHTAIFYRCNRRWSKWLWPMQSAQKIKLIAESTYQIITYYHFNGLDNDCFSLRILAERTKYWWKVVSIVRVPFSFQQWSVDFSQWLNISKLWGSASYEKLIEKVHESSNEFNLSWTLHMAFKYSKCSKNFMFISFRTSSWEDIILLSKTSTIGIARRMDGMTHFQQAVFNI